MVFDADRPGVDRPSRFWDRFEKLDLAVLQLGRLGKAVAAGLVGIVFLLLIAGVLARPWNNLVFSLAFEVSVMLLWPIAFLGLANIWRLHGHMQFDLFLRTTRGRRHHVLGLCSAVAACFVGILFVWQGWISFISQYQSGNATPTFRYPIWPLYSSVLLGSCIMALELLSSILREIREILVPSGSEESIYGAGQDPDVPQ